MCHASYMHSLSEFPFASLSNRPKCHSEANQAFLRQYGRSKSSTNIAFQIQNYIQRKEDKNIRRGFSVGSEGVKMFGYGMLSSHHSMQQKQLVSRTGLHQQLHQIKQTV